MGKSRLRDESNKKNLKSLAGLEAEISMERTDARTDGRRTDGRKCEHISVTTIVGYAKNRRENYKIDEKMKNRRGKEKQTKPQKIDKYKNCC